MCGRERLGMLLAVLGVWAGAAPLSAQVDEAVLPAPRAVLVGGVVATDLGEADPADGGSMIGLRLDLPLGRRIVLEPSVERLSLDTDDGASVRWQADFAVRGEVELDRIHPYAGGALGFLLWPGDARPAEADYVVATYGGAFGVRVDVTSRIGLRGEVRLRWLDGLESSTRTFDAGVSWRF